MHKISILKKKKNKNTDKVEWALVSKKDHSKVLKWFGTQKPSKDAVQKEEKRVQFFKHKKAEVLEIVEEIATKLDTKSMIHLADALTDCIEAIANDCEEEMQVPIRLGKIANLLDHKGEYVLAEKLDAVLPDLISAGNENVGAPEEVPVTQKCRLNASAAFEMASKFKNQYMCGEIDENSLEYAKAQELEDMLKMGFLLPPPKGMKSLPKKEENWWEYFANNT